MNCYYLSHSAITVLVVLCNFHRAFYRRSEIAHYDTWSISASGIRPSSERELILTQPCAKLLCSACSWSSTVSRKGKFRHSGFVCCIANMIILFVKVYSAFVMRFNIWQTKNRNDACWLSQIILRCFTAGHSNQWTDPLWDSRSSTRYFAGRY